MVFCMQQGYMQEKFSLEVNYGVAGNNFVRDYIETKEDGYIPTGARLFAKKKFLGSVGQIQLNYHLKNSTSVSVGYTRDMHQQETNYTGYVGDTDFRIDNFALRHNNNIYFAKHRRNLNEAKTLKYHFGLFYLRPEQQEIDIKLPPYFAPQIVVEERDTPNFNLNEAGILAGVDYKRQIDTKFKVGLHLSGYYVASASYYETTYLTGSLSYAFSKK